MEAFLTHSAPPFHRARSSPKELHGAEPTCMCFLHHSTMIEITQGPQEVFPPRTGANSRRTTERPARRAAPQAAGKHDLLCRALGARLHLADAEQQNAKTQGRKEIPFGSRAWAAFGRILGRAAGESAILLSSRSARAFSRGSPKDAPARSAAPTPVAQCRSLRPCAFASLRFASSSI